MSQPDSSPHHSGPPTRGQARPAVTGPRWARLSIVALISFGLLARLALAFVVGESRAGGWPQAREYLEIAQSVVQGQGLRSPGGLATRMPGYPLVLVAADATGHTLRALAVFQSVCGAAAMVLALVMAWRLDGVWAGLVAAALLAFDAYQVYLAGIVIPQVPLGLALAAAVLAGLVFLEAAERPGWRRWIWAAVAGAALAAAAYLDAVLAGLAVAAGLAAVVSRRRRRLLAGWAVGAAVMLAALAPWMVRNAVCLGWPVLTTDLGLRLYEGTQSDCEKPDGRYSPDTVSRQAQGLGEVGRDVLYLESAAGRVAEDPAGWLGRVGRRAGGMWCPASGANDWLPLSGAGYTSLVPALVLGLAGVWAMRRRREMLVWLLLGPAYVTVAGGLLCGGALDRIAVMPALAVLGGVGVAAVLQRQHVHV